MAALQRVLLGSKYMPRISNQSKIQILILDRKGSRSLLKGIAIASRLRQDSVFKDIIEVVYVQDMKGSLHDQALLMHSADIVLSPMEPSLQTWPSSSPALLWLRFS